MGIPLHHSEKDKEDTVESSDSSENWNWKGPFGNYYVMEIDVREAVDLFGGLAFQLWHWGNEKWIPLTYFQMLHVVGDQVMD